MGRRSAGKVKPRSHSKNSKSKKGHGDGKHRAHKKLKGSKKDHEHDVHMKFRLRGKAPPIAKSGPTPSQMTPDQMTTIYQVPSSAFKDENEVIAYNGWEVGNEIGKGGFATIYKAKSIKGSKSAAIKVVEIGNDQSRIDEMKTEIFIMEMMDNMYTIKLYAHFMINGLLYIIMQLADGGSFGKLLEKEGPFDEKDAARYFGQMIVGIEHLHEKNVAHRDIKPANFLITVHKGENVVLVADYGLSRVIRRDDKGNPKLYSTQCGTPAFMAPEVLSMKEYNPFLYDVWSLGITLYGMLNMQGPFNCEAEDSGLSQMLKNEWLFTDRMRAEPSEALQDLMTKMLEPNFEQRITMKGLSTHDWSKDSYKIAKKNEKNHK